jgi:hypothetical protein
MNTIKSITIATLIAAVSSFAHAGVEQYGRGTPGIGAGASVPSAVSVDVQTVQGRASIVVYTQAVKNDQTVVARAASDVQGRS